MAAASPVHMTSALLLQAHIENTCKAAIAERNVYALESALTQASEAGINTPIVAQARKVLDEAKKEKNVEEALQAAIDKRCTSDLEAAVFQANEFGFQCPHLDEAKELLDTLKAQEAAVKALEGAVKAKKQGALSDALDKAKAAGLGEEVKIFKKASEMLTGIMGKEAAANAKAAEEAAKNAAAASLCPSSFFPHCPLPRFLDRCPDYYHRVHYGHYEHYY